MHPLKIEQSSLWRRASPLIDTLAGVWVVGECWVLGGAYMQDFLTLGFHVCHVGLKLSQSLVPLCEGLLCLSPSSLGLSLARLWGVEQKDGRGQDGDTLSLNKVSSGTQKGTRDLGPKSGCHLLPV